MTSVQLQVPSDVLAALREDETPDEGADRVTLTVSIDGLDVVGGVATTRELKDQLPTIAQAICGCVFRRPPSATTRLLVEGPGLETRVTLPPDVSPHQVLTTLAGLVDSVERSGRTDRSPRPTPSGTDAALAQVRRASSDPSVAVRTPSPRAPHGD